MNKSMTFAVRTIAISAMIALGCGAVNASTVGEGTQQYVVRFADLDLAKMAGATALYSRLRHAARVVCDSYESRETGMAAQYRSCIDQAVAAAVASVNRPLLSQYHELRTQGDNAGHMRLAKAH